MRFNWHWQLMDLVQKEIKIPGGADVPFIMLRILFCSSWCCCCCCCCSSCCFCWYCCCWSVGTATAGFTIKHTVIIIIIITDCFYMVLFSALKQTHCAHVTCDPEWLYPFIAPLVHHTTTHSKVIHKLYVCLAVICHHPRGVLTALSGCYMAGATWKYCHLDTCFVTIQPCTSLQCPFIQRAYAGCMCV